VMRGLWVYIWLLILGAPWVAWLYRWLRTRDRERRSQLIRQSREAGYHLVEQHKWPQAVATLDRALALVTKHTPKQEADLHFYRGYALEQMQQVEEALSAYAACQAKDAGPSLQRYKPLAAFRRGYLLAQLERWDDAERELRESIKGSSRIPLPKLHLSALRILLRVCQATSRHAQALEWAQEALRLTHDLGDESVQALILDTAGDVHLALGQAEQALRKYERSLDLFRKLGHADTALVVKRDIGALYQACGEWDKAFAWFQACLREAEHAQDLAGQARIVYDIACLRVHRGELDAAAGLLQRSIGLFRQARDAAGADQVGRTLIGLGVWMHRQATADQMTFRDIERGSATMKKEEGE
jgi:tetratricopeptide (TPR) repeat protein